ncbi:hypothetical protein AGABI1DRAFT_114627 [Agaricus bisporus var. burnettii JB137-S8]|uniref:Hydrophobin n=1 Tax=Agaricus bisporus var. burnettii (strain JB137-S8 / ATCC MYA-4627 / FGSC 10392) TaxID=597362 RepID=K5X554_AGABU|nr:uncharacterized protein AGABI1DRAFT_114627 [Agaricus bisporus var. burnettii JB137-S8]EKM78318.1 hypothetical protein AGABI1DRAFT_114627 [Agaricus bisporus var. burnettii JB137-S8]
MKFNTVFTFITLSAASVYAANYETNASRLARGLPPLPPTRRTSSWGAKRAQPSGVPSNISGCNSGQVQCCSTVMNSADSNANTLMDLMNMASPVTNLIGLNCSPLGGTGGNRCTSQTLCCENNSSDGLVSTGCTPSRRQCLIS